MQQRTGAVACQEQEQRNTDVRDDVERKEDDEFKDLTETEGRVDGAVAWWVEALERGFVDVGVVIGVVAVVVVVVVVGIGVAILLGRDIARGKNEMFVALADEDLVQKFFSH